MSRIRIGLAQIDTTVGDLAGNVARIGAWLEEARSRGADLVAFPELAITGYPPEDLLLKPSFVEANRAALEEVAARTAGITAVVGFVDRGLDLYNAAAVLHDGAIVGIYHKHRLPNYGVFDERRYFRPGTGEALYRVAGAWVGVTVCEDIWSPGGPVGRLALAGADVIVNVNASPFHRGKWRSRQRMLATRAVDYGVAVAYVNQVGGQDELVFDGNSVVFGADGELLAEAAAFREELLLCDIELEEVFRARLHDPRSRYLPRPAGGPVERHVLSAAPPSPAPPPLPAAEPIAHDDVEEVYDALVLGTRDYVRKNGFERVVLGLSGGLDSSLVAVIAADALGAENVTGVSLPSRYSSEGSRTDAKALADALGIQLLDVPIERVFAAALETLAPTFEGRPADITEENLQARIRGMLLMALSNKFGWLVLTTGNKSEMATGYSTLYGDMAGGFAPLKDVPKTLVYDLARRRNARGPRPVIPEAVLVKPPSAELRPGQLDTDALPPYEELDPILERYVERDWSMAEFEAAGFDAALVRRVIAMVDRSEYKRRQAPPGIKVTPRAFGKDRRLPLSAATHRWEAPARGTPPTRRRSRGS
ncbi:MAG TPA: NAD+ synthase [Longimicrobiales bacterium]